MKKCLLPLLVLSTVLIGCNQGGGTSGSQNSFSNATKFEEMARFFNSSKLDFSVSYKFKNITSSLFNAYADSEKYIITYDLYPGVRNIATKDKTFIEGDGIKAYKLEDNSRDFESEEFDINNYIESGKFDKNGNFSCVFDVKSFSTESFIFDVDELDSMLDYYGADMDDVPLTVTFNEGKVKDLNFALKGVLPASGTQAKIDMTLSYNVNAYGDEVETQVVDFSEYQEVSASIFQLGEMHIGYYIENGEGFTVEPVRHSMGFHTEYIGVGESDFVVAKMKVASVPDFEMNICFSQTTYDGENENCIFDLCGKKYIIPCDFVPVYPAAAIDDVSVSRLSYASSYHESWEHDFQNNRVLLKTADNKVTIFNGNSLRIDKELTFRGVVKNILSHENVYHIMALTSDVSSSAQDTDCNGIIYIINKETLEIDNFIQVNTYPYNTAIDNRGDIIIVPGVGSWVPLYVYHVDTGNLEAIEGRKISNRSYLSYDKENDLIVVNDTVSSGAVYPEFYSYKEGHYVQEAKQGSNKDHTDYGVINFTYKNFIIADTKIIDVKDWNNPKVYDAIDSYYSWEFSFSFAKDNTIYHVTKDFSKGILMIVKIDITDTGISKKVYSVNASAINYSFGFAKDDNIYLFDSNAKAFNIINLA